MTDVQYRATQRAGLRGVGFEIGLITIYLVVAPVLSRTAGGPELWFAVAVAAVLVRVALFSGPHHRGIEVTATQLCAGRFELPLAGIVEVKVVDRRELRRRSQADEVAHESVPPGPTEAVVLHNVSPEGARYAFGAAVDDAAALRDHLEQARARATTTTPDRLRPVPFEGRQGVDRGVAAAALLVTVALDVLTVVVQGRPLGVTVLMGLFVLRSARRRVVVDGSGLRSGRFELAWREVERARLVPLGEARLLPSGRSLLPLWAPPWVLVVVRRGPTGASLRARTVLVGLPVPVDLSTGDGSR